MMSASSTSTLFFYLSLFYQLNNVFGTLKCTLSPKNMDFLKSYAALYVFVNKPFINMYCTTAIMYEDIPMSYNCVFSSHLKWSKPSPNSLILKIMFSFSTVGPVLSRMYGQ